MGFFYRPRGWCSLSTGITPFWAFRCQLVIPVTLEAPKTNTGASAESIRSLTATFNLTFTFLLIAILLPHLPPPSSSRYGALPRPRNRSLPPRSPAYQQQLKRLAELRRHVVRKVDAFASPRRRKRGFLERWPKLTTSRTARMTRSACRVRTQMHQERRPPSAIWILPCLGEYRIFQDDVHRLTGSSELRRSRDILGDGIDSIWRKLFARDVQSTLGAPAAHKSIASRKQTNLTRGIIFPRSKF